jgi:hypothetical protein
LPFCSEITAEWRGAAKRREFRRSRNEQSDHDLAQLTFERLLFRFVKLAPYRTVEVVFDAQPKQQPVRLIILCARSSTKTGGES